MVAKGHVRLRGLGDGRAGEVRFGRFLGNAKVSVERIIAGWSDRTAPAAAGRHVLAIQDTSEILFRTTPEQRRGLGEIGKGNGHGVLIHAMLAADAQDGACLGLVGGRVWTRHGRVAVAHRHRRLADKESERWVSTAEAAKSVLAQAARITVVADRESDLYEEWARVPDTRFHLLTRAMQDRRLVDDGHLFTAAQAWPEAGRQEIVVRERAGERTATVRLRFGPVSLRRPKTCRAPGLPGCVTVNLVQVEECDPPAGREAVCWRLLTTHALPDAAAAWQVVGWYRQRWLIEQVFRTLKQQGLRLEDSQLEDAERLLKLSAIATKAAAITVQLVQARDGRTRQPALVVFAAADCATLRALAPGVEGRTAKQKNPHPPDSLAWAAWIIARLGGWDGYAGSRPPGPITFRRGLTDFAAISRGFALRTALVCIP